MFKFYNFVDTRFLFASELFLLMFWLLFEIPQNKYKHNSDVYLNSVSYFTFK